MQPLVSGPAFHSISQVFPPRLLDLIITGDRPYAEDGYEEQILIPSRTRKLAGEEGINTENKQKIAVTITLDFRGVLYGEGPHTGNHQIYLPVEIQ